MIGQTNMIEIVDIKMIKGIRLEIFSATVLGEMMIIDRDLEINITGIKIRMKIKIEAEEEAHQVIPDLNQLMIMMIKFSTHNKQINNKINKII